jgi:hypothetical protein
MSLDRYTEIDASNDERLRAIDAALREQEAALRAAVCEAYVPPDDDYPKRTRAVDWVLAVAVGACLALALEAWIGEPDPNASQHVVRVTT